ncbi:MAG TPA: hypothetical protein PKZ27_03080 [Rhodocyclaceae bacterium]|nr:hypothetical protein [Rhodocyclaceae bacterium]
MRPSLGTALKPKRKTGSHIQRHDMGDGQMLTTREIARVIGGTPHNVRARLAKGWKGEALLTPLGERRRIGKPKGQTQVIAYKLAVHFKHRIPSTKEIMTVHPMEESNACYWRNAIVRALEELT